MGVKNTTDNVTKSFVYRFWVVSAAGIAKLCIDVSRKIVNMRYFR